MIYEVVVKQKTNTPTFDYSSRKSLDCGQLVKIPFGRKTVLGVVYKKKQSSSYTVKPIRKVLTKKPIVSHDQFEFARLLSREYISPLSQTIFSFIPNFADKNLAILNYPSKASKRKGNFSTSINIGVAPNQLKEIKEDIRPAGQYLIIFPQIAEGLRAKEFLRSENVYIYNSKISERGKIEIFSRLLGAENITIIATRAGSLLPFTNLKTVFMFDPADFAYQEDQEPRYNGERAAYIMSRTYGAKLKYLSTSFDIFTYTGCKKKIITSNDNIKYPIFTIVRSKDILCDSVMEKISENSKGGHKTLLVIPTSENLFCKKCRSPLICSKCRDTRIDDKNICKICKNKTVACAKCRGTEFEQTRFNSKTISNELKDYKNIYVKNEHEIDNSSTNHKFSKIIYFNNDYHLHSSSYGAKLKLMIKLRRLLNFFPLEIVIITQDEQSNFWKYFVQPDQEEFFNRELAERKQNHLPPFTRLVKIKKIKTNKSDNEIIDKLKNIFEHIDTESGIYLFAPFDSSSSSKLEQSLVNLKSAKYFIDPIDLD